MTGLSGPEGSGLLLWNDRPIMSPLEGDPGSEVYRPKRKAWEALLAEAPGWPEKPLRDEAFSKLGALQTTFLEGIWLRLKNDP